MQIQNRGNMLEERRDLNTSGHWSGLALTAALMVSSLTGCSTADTGAIPPTAGPQSSAKINPAAAEEDLGALVLPAKVKIHEDVLALGTDLTMYSGSTEIGSFNQTNWVSGTSFEFLDQSGALIAKAQERLFSWGVTIDIYDGTGVQIGRVEENILKNLLSIKSHYSVYDAKDNLVASSEKLDFFATTVEIKDASGNPVATLKRPTLNLTGDKWNMEFHNETVDKRLFIFIPCYKTHADNQKD